MVFEKKRIEEKNCEGQKTNFTISPAPLKRRFFGVLLLFFCMLKKSLKSKLKPWEKEIYLRKKSWIITCSWERGGKTGRNFVEMFNIVTSKKTREGFRNGDIKNSNKQYFHRFFFCCCDCCSCELVCKYISTGFFGIFWLCSKCLFKEKGKSEVVSFEA